MMNKTCSLLVMSVLCGTPVLAGEWVQEGADRFSGGLFAGTEIDRLSGVSLASFRGINLALDAVASSGPNTLSGRRSVTDGDTDTEWRFDNEVEVLGEWIRIDLGGDRGVRQVRLLPGKTVAQRPLFFVKGYRLEVARAAQDLKRPVPTLDDGVVAHLQAHAWPGNVRELEHVIRRAVLLCKDGVVRVENVSLPAGEGERPLAESPTEAPPPTEAVDEKQQILAALQSTHWRVSGVHGAAALLGMHPEKLRYHFRLTLALPGLILGGYTALASGEWPIYLTLWVVSWGVFFLYHIIRHLAPRFFVQALPIQALREGMVPRMAIYATDRAGEYCCGAEIEQGQDVLCYAGRPLTKGQVRTLHEKSAGALSRTLAMSWKWNWPYRLRPSSLLLGC